MRLLHPGRLSRDVSTLYRPIRMISKYSLDTTFVSCYPSAWLPLTNLDLLNLHCFPFRRAHTQVFSFQRITYLPPQRALLNPLFINHFRTLFIVTGVYSLPPVFQARKFRPADGSTCFRAIPCFFKFLRTLLHFFALTQDSTLLFSSASALFAKNHQGWGEGSMGWSRKNEMTWTENAPKPLSSLTTVNCPLSTTRHVTAQETSFVLPVCIEKIQEGAVRTFTEALLAPDALDGVNLDASERRIILVRHPEHAVFHRAVLHASRRSRATRAALGDYSQFLRLFLACGGNTLRARFKFLVVGHHSWSFDDFGCVCHFQ